MVDSETFARAVTAEQLLGSAGWQLIVDLLKDYEQRRTADLMAYQGSDSTVMKHRQMAVRAVAEVRQALTNDLNEAVIRAREYAEEQLLEMNNGNEGTSRTAG